MIVVSMKSQIKVCLLAGLLQRRSRRTTRGSSRVTVGSVLSSWRAVHERETSSESTCCYFTPNASLSSRWMLQQSNQQLPALLNILRSIIAANWTLRCLWRRQQRTPVKEKRSERVLGLFSLLLFVGVSLTALPGEYMCVCLLPAHCFGDSCVIVSPLWSVVQRSCLEPATRICRFLQTKCETRRKEMWRFSAFMYDFICKLWGCRSPGTSSIVFSSAF